MFSNRTSLSPPSVRLKFDIVGSCKNSASTIYVPFCKKVKTSLNLTAWKHKILYENIVSKFDQNIYSTKSKLLISLNYILFYLLLCSREYKAQTFYKIYKCKYVYSTYFYFSIKCVFFQIIFVWFSHNRLTVQCTYGRPSNYYTGFESHHTSHFTFAILRAWKKRDTFQKKRGGKDKGRFGRMFNF